MTVEAAIIGVLGAGLLGLLGAFLQAIRSEIRALGERLDRRIQALETATRNELGTLKDDLGTVKDDLGTVKERLAAIEATQAEHGRLLERMMGHGERIAALEGAVGAG